MQDDACKTMNRKHFGEQLTMYFVLLPYMDLCKLGQISWGLKLLIYDI